MVTVSGACSPGLSVTAGGAVCADSPATLQTGTNVNDCADEGYQGRKLMFYQLRKACKDIQAARTTEMINAGLTDPQSICSYPLEKLLTKCDQATGACTYTATSGSPPSVQAACSNDFSTCTDSGYLSAVQTEQQYISECQAAKNEYETTGYAVMAVFIILLLLCVAGGITAYVYSLRRQEEDLKKAHPQYAANPQAFMEAQPPKKSPLGPVLLVFGVILALGVAGYVYLASSEDESTQGQATALIAVVAVLAVLALAGYFGYLAYTNKTKKEEGQTLLQYQQYKDAQAAKNAQNTTQRTRKGKRGRKRTNVQTASTKPTSVVAKPAPPGQMPAAPAQAVPKP
jgi:Tfp pilus assembly protein PilE/uncharacterized membrane protein